MRDHKPLVALIGAPNSGKTTLFNWLTGSSYRAVNYPGATVDCYRGQSVENLGAEMDLLDTPGTYSLLPKGADEEVTYKVLFEKKLGSSPDHVIVVVDGTQLSRQLVLPLQLKQCGFNFTLAVTMADLIHQGQSQVDRQKLAETLGCQVVLINGQNGDGVKDLARAVQKDLLKPGKMLIAKENLGADVVSTHRQSRELAERVLPASAVKQNYYLSTQMFDRWLLHPWLGVIVFFCIMALFFSSIFWLATPLMDLVDSGFSYVVSVLLESYPNQLWSDFLANGVVASFAAVFVFVPQILILFIGLGLLEDSGYLARAATLMDKPFAWVGLSGRSFVPVLSGFACAVPAMMATRNIRSRKERWLTMFILPFMTCSARLPVYALLLGFLFWGQKPLLAGAALAVIYFLSLLLGALAAAILNKFIKIDHANEFLLELPIYRRPKTRVVVRHALHRTMSYIRRAGPMIFVLAMIVWAGTNFPRPDGAGAEQQLSLSYAGQVGRVLEPMFEPMGADWRVGLGLITAFAAREVFVSSLAIIFNLSEDVDEEGLRAQLLDKMKVATFADGRAVFNWPSVVSLIVFFMIALQCISTSAMAAKEMGSTRFAVIQLVALNVLAYIAAIVTYQVMVVVV